MFDSHQDLIQQIADFLKFHDYEEIEVKVRLTNGEEVKFELTRAEEEDWEEAEECDDDIVRLIEDETDWDEGRTDWNSYTDPDEED